jgi:O-6-methylguanine DNA methyltransferase
MKTFEQRVKDVVRVIPKGSVLSYKEVAIAAKSPKAARAVANIMAKNFDGNIPCHRVIRFDGSLGGYNRGGTSVKKQILFDENAVL